jgi:hypothetical protein
VCGDVAVILPTGSGLLLAIVDGLGHGTRAWEAASAAEAWLRDHASADVAAISAGVCERLRKTDGAAVGVCHVEHESGRVRYAGIGNTVLRTFGRQREGRLISRDGIAGRTSEPAKVYSAQADPGDLLLLYSDGVPSQFRISECPSLLGAEPGAAAREVVTRFGRDYDDAACIAARWQATPTGRQGDT